MRYLMAAIGGAMIGAAAGLLLAPDTGSATRSKIRDKCVGLGHDVEDFVESKSQHLRNKIQGMGHKFRGTMDQAQEMVQNMTGTTDPGMDMDETFGADTTMRAGAAGAI